MSCSNNNICNLYSASQIPPITIIREQIFVPYGHPYPNCQVSCPCPPQIPQICAAPTYYPSCQQICQPTICQPQPEMCTILPPPCPEPFPTCSVASCCQQQEPIEINLCNTRNGGGGGCNFNNCNNNSCGTSGCCSPRISNCSTPHNNSPCCSSGRSLSPNREIRGRCPIKNQMRCSRDNGLCHPCRESCCNPVDDCTPPVSTSSHYYCKTIHRPGCNITPGYRGHVPGYKFHGASRTFGNATRDTYCIMSQRNECCPKLPVRIYEQ